MREFLGNRGVNAMLAHEVAHQWFGHETWPRDGWLDNWLTESFAEYFAGLAMGWAESNVKAKVGMRGFKEMHAEWWRFAREVEGLGTIRGANRLSGDLGWNYRVDLLYNRGPLVLHQLRTLVGDQRFQSIVKEWLGSAAKGPSDTSALARAAGKVLRQDMGWYFDQWLDQTTIPEVEVKYEIVPNGSGALLRGRVVQHGDEFYKLHVPLILAMPGGRTDVRLVFQESPTQDFEFELPATPSKVMVDPSGNNLAEYR